MREPLPFDRWPEDHFERTYQAEDALGTALAAGLKEQMPFMRRKCAALAPALAEAELEAVVREAAFGGIYALLMVLDGVARTPIDGEHGITWAVQAKILHSSGETQSLEVPLASGGSMALSPFRPSKTECVETVEVLPNGDGLCYASHGWKEAFSVGDTFTQ